MGDTAVSPMLPYSALFSCYLLKKYSRGHSPSNLQPSPFLWSKVITSSSQFAICAAVAQCKYCQRPEQMIVSLEIIMGQLYTLNMVGWIIFIWSLRRRSANMEV